MRRQEALGLECQRLLGPHHVHLPGGLVEELQPPDEHFLGENPALGRAHDGRFVGQHALHGGERLLLVLHKLLLKLGQPRHAGGGENEVFACALVQYFTEYIYFQRQAGFSANGPRPRCWCSTGSKP